MTSPRRGLTPTGITRGLTSYGDAGLSAFIRRAFTKGMGFTDEDMARPVIGICNTFSEFNNCHSHFRGLAEAVKRGVWQAGGFPLEFPTISLGELFLSPTSMLLRNLAAMDAEEMIRAQPMDGVVLMCGCDKTVPAHLMAAASADVPAIVLTGGPMLNGRYEGRDLGACTDCRRVWAEYRAGTIDEQTVDAIEEALCRSAGTCMSMGTASTMAAIVEALGMSLPGCAAIPAVDARRLQLAERTGRQIVEVARQGIRPSRVMTAAALANAIRVCMALGGSTNAVVHLVAVAGRLGIDLPLALFDELSRATPLLANVKPSGAYQMENLFEAGGIPAVMKELEPLLDLDQLTVTGWTIGEYLAGVAKAERWREIIAPLERPLHPEGGLAILRGNLAPDGAVIKQSAASPNLLRHTGRAVVFSSLADLARVDDPDLDITADDVMVLQNAGPVGGPGMPEAGMLPIPKKLLAQGIRDVVRISDARMSGTAFGTVVLHVAPEAAVGGPLALVRTGDRIALDVPARRLDLLVDEAELAQRRAEWRPPASPFTRGYGRLFVEHVLQADRGCDFDFLTRSGR
ncbi:MAG: dihydroxy-acid dehydratase [Chloroflexi bacterium]|nr:dihydroxy-acid dehydratase [Chloroflexota bacterium]